MHKVRCEIRNSSLPYRSEIRVYRFADTGIHCLAFQVGTKETFRFTHETQIKLLHFAPQMPTFFGFQPSRQAVGDLFFRPLVVSQRKPGRQANAILDLPEML